MSAAVAFIPDPSAQRSVWRPRRPFRAPDGLPKGRENWRLGAGVSAALHLLLILLIVAPFAFMKEITLIDIYRSIWPFAMGLNTRVTYRRRPPLLKNARAA